MHSVLACHSTTCHIMTQLMVSQAGHQSDTCPTLPSQAYLPVLTTHRFPTGVALAVLLYTAPVGDLDRVIIFVYVAHFGDARLQVVGLLCREKAGVSVG